jgi:ribosomal-protein-alanine N-acetyltransferase
VEGSFSLTRRERIETARLVLRRPLPSDAEAIFTLYASDPEVTRYLSWPTHRTVEDTRAFLAWSDGEWERWPAGPYLVLWREDGRPLGSTGLAFQSPEHAATGYAFARFEWGHGYATESLQAMVDLARQLGVLQLGSICHVDHRLSAHVLEKCGFQCLGIRREDTEFPNLAPGRKSDVLCYVRTFPDRSRER